MNPMRNSQEHRAALAIATVLWLVTAGAVLAGLPADAGRDRAAATLTAEGIAEHIQVLSADAFEGRAPDTAGEKKSLDYITNHLRAAGVSPVKGGYLQKVPLLKKRLLPTTRVAVHGKGRDIPLVPGEGMTAKTGGTAGRVGIENSELVFVGYGIVADEHGWNDYAGVDVQGKTVVVLMNDPAGVADSLYFKGRALSHYGTSLNKNETAARMGARGIIVVHDQAVIGYPWEVISGGAKNPYFDRELPKTAPGRCAFSMLVPKPVALELFSTAGKDFAALAAEAARGNFHAVPLGLTLQGEINVRVERSQTHNVVGCIRGRERPDEYVIYTAHWDHVGIGKPVEGDSIYNGAVDNASGTAVLMELAEAYAALPEAPKRSVVFIATGAEEQGLLGAYHYADHPLFPLENTVAVINMDALFPFGDFNGLTVVGLGSSELENYLKDAAESQGRKLIDDPTPEYGAFFRSDHYPFAKKGVPALFAVGGPLDDPPPSEEMNARFAAYMQKGYHKPQDEYDAATWDMRGIQGDARIYFLTGYTIANDARVPNWFLGSEFRSLRDAMRDTSK